MVRSLQGRNAGKARTSALLDRGRDEYHADVLDCSGRGTCQYALRYLSSAFHCGLHQAAVGAVQSRIDVSFNQEIDGGPESDCNDRKTDEESIA